MLADWTAHPTLRARHIDREYAMGMLRDASTDGQLSAEEFDERLRQAMRATTLGDLVALVGDLQGPRVPPRPVRPYVPPTPVPVSIPRTRHRPGVVAVALALVAALALVPLAGFFTGATSGMESGSDIAMPEPAVGPVVLDDGALDPTAQGFLDQLGMPIDVPIPSGIAFTGDNWQSASTDGKRTTYQWHLEYVFYDQMIEPIAVSNLYLRSVLVPAGPSVQRNRPDTEGIELVWSAKEPTDDTLVLRTDYTAKGSLRVSIDLTSVRPAQARTDVPGELGTALRSQQVATAKGMTYVQSRVSQLGTDPSRCLLEQVWLATHEQYAKARTRATGPDVEITDTQDGKQLTYTATTSCGPLAFQR